MADSGPGRTARAATSSSHTASLRLSAGSASLQAEVAISTRGLMALGAMIAGTLLSAAVIVVASTRKLPQGAMPRSMVRRR
ncbi:hypothetical protein [Luteimonas deserti]|uniref:Uncharacterized protein n=1 Tax=Luteimonas deserti TaxID=2752306 RepID=A0A7Z0TW45_9GAMM|nr:hypothetical protein [Luteimonas deserti]NYZ62929.1 hypothetical protein [Luteimonas deserti]